VKGAVGADDGGGLPPVTGGSDGGSPGTDAGSTDAGKPSFSVANLPGLTLWLDAAKGISLLGGSVSKWADQSGKGNNATSGSGMVPPTVLASGANGLPAINFSGAETDMNFPASTLGTGDFLLEMVADYGTDVGQNPLFFAGTNSMFTIAGPSASSKFVVGATLVPGTDSPGLHLYGARRTGSGSNATAEIRLNGATHATMTAQGFSQVLGALETMSGQANISELVVVTGTTSASDLAALEGYLKTKYGL
jgi:hypothetical protein